MEVKFEKIFERDVDLLIINKFLNDSNFKNYFLDKINLCDYDVVKVEHSLMDCYGESDVTIILSNGIEKIGLLIEDKIDAIAMPNQKNRYDIRGNKGLERKEYDRFFVFIVAPNDYLQTNEESKKYENRISYESLLNLIKDDIYSKSVIEQAIEEKKKGYIIIENENVTRFWQEYYTYIKTNYPQLYINEVNGPRGGKANWPHIKTPIKNVYISHKSDRGFMDLTFSGLGEQYNLFRNSINEYLDDDMSVYQTGKSIAIRLHVPIIDFKNNFNDYLSEMKYSLDSAMRLYKLLEKIDISDIY